MVFPLDADEFVQNIKESNSGDILSTSFEVRNTLKYQNKTRAS